MNGTATISPVLKSGHANIGGFSGRGDLEIQAPQPVNCTVADGKLTRSGHDHVTLLAPETGWQWQISFDDLYVGDTPVVLETFRFPVEEATPEQLADDDFAGVNIATFAAEHYDVPPVSVSAIARMVEILTDVHVMYDDVLVRYPQIERWHDASVASAAAASDSEDAAAASERNAKASEDSSAAHDTSAGASASAAAESESRADASASAAASSEGKARQYSEAAAESQDAAESERVTVEQIRTALEALLADSEAWAGFEEALSQLEPRMAAEVNKLKGDAPEAFDTLGEVAAWIADHGDEAAAMLQNISERAKKTYVDEQLSGKADKGAENTAQWSQVSGKPATFPSTIDAVVGLSDALANAGSKNAEDLTGWLTPSVNASNATLSLNGEPIGSVAGFADMVFDHDENKMDKSAIQVVDELPAEPDPNTVYLVRE